MPYLELGWRSAALIACVLALLGASRLRFAPFAREAAVVLGLFALWQFAGSVAVMQTDGAVARGRWLWHAERVIHLPSESAVQRFFLPHAFVVRVFDSYYNVAHLTGMVVFLAWLFVRHRDRYARVRTTLVCFTAAAFVIQLLPVAPPRLIGVGLVDTALAHGESVYGAGLSADQLAAMPSVHVGWAVLIAAVAWVVSSSRWRWIGVAHAVLTCVVVVATANHYWLDGAAAIALLVLVVAVQKAVSELVVRASHEPMPQVGSAVQVDRSRRFTIPGPTVDLLPREPVGEVVPPNRVVSRS